MNSLGQSQPPRFCSEQAQKGDGEACLGDGQAWIYLRLSIAGEYVHNLC